jgi:chromate transporter
LNGGLRSSRLREVAQVFLRLGCTAFGGPAAHIALMRRELVEQRKWVTDQRFLDLLGATNLIPGPNSTEMAIHLGYVRAGWPGLLVAGGLFILPAMLAVLALAWVYVTYQTLPAVAWVFQGIQPVVIGLVVHALWQLKSAALRSTMLWAVAIGAMLLQLAGIDELAIMGLGALVVLIERRAWRGHAALAAFSLGGLQRIHAIVPPLAAVPVDLVTLFLTFLKIGAVLYGGGYVLLAFLRRDFVERLGWITDQQLLDAVVVGQLTPGPLFTSATFVGYLVGGVPGALVATVGIFLPSFVFVALSNPLIPRLRGFAPTAALLDGVNAAAIGLMAAVTIVLSRTAFFNPSLDPLSVFLAAATLAALVRTQINPIWLVLAGGAVGVARHLTAP